MRLKLDGLVNKYSAAISSILVFVGFSNKAMGETFTIGYIPSSFPRDPLKINQAGEHLILAQLLETLVTHDNEGNIVNGVASQWRFSKDSKSIEFTIDDKKRFYNGKAILAKDVAYSINRHRTSNESQSYQFLQNIESISVLDDKKISVKLKRPQLSILKALSRSQLGIVPDGWVFDGNSDQPFVGSGKYILVRRASHWHLNLRKDLPEGKPVGVIQDWKIVFGMPSDVEITSQSIPDYIPLARAGVIERIRQDSRFSTKTYHIEESFTLGQTAAWWFPRGKNYSNLKLQKLAMGAMRELFERRRSKLNFKASTGLVPRGVPGHLPEKITFQEPPTSDQKQSVKIMLNAANFKEIFDPEDRAFIEKKYNISFEVFVESQKWKEELEIQKPDIYVIAWLGGFADPEGFLPVLTSMLKIDFAEFLGPARKIYENASAELQMTNRNRLFQEFNAALVSSEKMVPAWQPAIFSMTKKGLKSERILFRYTPDLFSIRLKQ